MEQRGGDGVCACVNVPEQVAAGSRCRGGGDKVQVPSAVETALSTSVFTVVEQLYSVNAVEVETGSAVQSEPQKVAGVRLSVSTRRLSAATATWGTGGITSCASPAHQSYGVGSVANVSHVSKVAIGATSVNEVLQQLSSLTQVGCDMRGCVCVGCGGVHERGR